MKRLIPVLLLIAVGVAGYFLQTPVEQPARSAPTKVSAPAPAIVTQSAFSQEERSEILNTLRRIDSGDNKFRQDGSTFQNREGRLPEKPRDYYKEYTVVTPGAENRGARRIIRGNDGELYYTSDHYRSFLRINEQAEVLKP